MTNSLLWWQTGVVYQIYPRSFQDSNADGIGDLPGIRSRLDYLEWLGVDAIWISPIYPSPMADFGYDVANYTDVEPTFGTLADFDQLLADAHQRHLRVLLDFVPNHTSDEHAWFIESRSSRTNPKRDWYIWRDPARDGGPPNNWESFFGGSAWTFDSRTGQYYLHLFDPKQPDLNWRNPDVKAAMFANIRFWLERGVDGFRIDVIWMLYKDEQLRDNPPNPNYRPGDPYYTRQLRIYTEDQPGIHELLQEMRAVFDEYDERVMIGEIYLPYAQLMRYYGPRLNEVHLPFNFALVNNQTWTAPAVREIVNSYEAALPEGATPNWVLGNHDRPRIASKVGPDQARIAQMLLLTLRGTPTCYYGEEIGMIEGDIPPEYIVDPEALRTGQRGRDPVRTPMQWDDSPYAGFSTVPPWLPLAEGYATRNVAMQRNDPTSMLSLTRRLMQLRRSLSALLNGSYRAISLDSDDGNSAAVFAYLRANDDQRVLVVLNFTDTPQQLNLSALATNGVVHCSTAMDTSGTVHLARLVLRPNEGLLIELE